MILQAVLVGFLIVASVLVEGAIAFGIARVAKHRIGGVGYVYSAFIFLFTYWLFLLQTHGILTYYHDRHRSHDHEHSALEFAVTTYENLQSEDWQIMLAAITFGLGAVGLKLFWRGTTESQD